MKSSWFAVPVIGIALFYANVAGVCQNAEALHEIRFRLIHSTLVVVAMKVNGMGPFDFVLDTGTDTTIIDQSFANELSLVPQGQVQQNSIGGHQMLIRSSLNSLALAAHEVRNHSVLIEDLAQLKRLDAHILGIAGQDFLSHFNYLLDYRRNSIRLEEGDEIQTATEGERVPMELKLNKMMVEAESRSTRDGKLRLALDSGATSVVLMEDASKRLKIPIRENRRGLTANGAVSVYAGTLQRLSIGSEEFRDLRALISVESARAFGDGLLPTSFFHSLYINNRESFVIFNPRTKK